MVTMQNFKDCALMKRVPGGIIDTRQLRVAVPVVGFILFILAEVVFTVVWITDDDPVRGNDVEFRVLVEHFDSSAGNFRRLLLILLARSNRSIRITTGLFAAPLFR